MGKAFEKLKVPRKDLVVSTKFFVVGKGVNDMMLSRKHLIEGMNNSLKRLQLDYVDVAFAHRYDHVTPMEEVCRAFDWIINHGKAFYWATSEWTPEQIMEANLCCERLNLIKPIADQKEYNMMIRDKFEVDFVPMYNKLGYGTTIWSPLASGFLTGKYNDGKIPEGSRFAGKLQQNVHDRVFNNYKEAWGDKLYDRLKDLAALAKELGCTQAQLAIAWCIVNKDVSTCILGASRPEQIVENLKALDVAKKWTPEIEKNVEDIIQNSPTPSYNWRDWKSEQLRRSVVVEALH
jgi:voltage-dependent potassium channel beta subunit